MMGSSRENLSGLRGRLDQRRGAPGIEDLHGELFAVADLVGQDTQLRSALADAGQPDGARAALVQALFAERLSPLAVEVLTDIVSQRWSNPPELVEAIEALAAQSAFMVAESAGTLDSVEAELFGFEQALAGSAELQMALTDPAVGPAAKAGLVGTLLEGRASQTTSQVLSYSMSHLRGRRADAMVEALIGLAAQQRDRSVAEVRVARPLDPDQAARLTAVLSRMQGRQVRLNTVLDPDVIGGISVRIGTQVIDGTVATRLEQARRALAG